MQKIRNIRVANLILIHLATCIIMLHSVLPHQHHSDLEQAEHSQAHAQVDGLIDFIKLIFHQDMGEGHMENFEQGQNLDINLSFSVDMAKDFDHSLVYHPILLNANSYSCDLTHLNPDDTPLFRRHVIDHLDFRGPPFTV